MGRAYLVAEGCALVHMAECPTWCQPVGVVAGEEDDLTGSDADRRLAFGPQQQPAGDGEGVGVQLGRREQRLAIFGATWEKMHQGALNSA
jgi:hypothetical protein